MATSKQSPQEELLGALKLALRAASDNPHAYVLIVKGPSGGRLIVNRKKIPPKVVADARKDVGSNVVVKGVCYGDGGTMVFESPEDPDELWSKVVRNLAKQAGLNLTLAFKKGRDDDQGETDEPSPAEGAAPQAQAAAVQSPPVEPPRPPMAAKMDAGQTPDELARLTQRLNSLLPQVKAANDPALIQSTKLVGGLIQKKDLAGARRALDALVAALNQALVGAPRTTVVADWKQARQGWLEANDRLNKQLESLRVAILAHAKEEPELTSVLADIADQGLNALTGNHRVRLMSLLQAVGEGDANAIKTHGAKALAALTAFKDHLSGNDKVDACEDNPWDVAVAIRGTLDPALDRLSQVLRAGIAQ